LDTSMLVSLMKINQRGFSKEYWYFLGTAGHYSGIYVCHSKPWRSKPREVRALRLPGRRFHLSGRTPALFALFFK
jgi:hypothetical protein